MTAPPTRIAILGAGALGSLWAGYLAETHAVSLVAKPGDRRSNHRFTLTTPEGLSHNLNLPLQCPDRLQCDLLLVTTKAPDTLAALSPLLAVLPHKVPVVLLQNGMGPQQALAQAFPEQALLAATTTEGAFRQDPRQIQHAGRGLTWIGGLTPVGSETLATVVRILGDSGLDCRATDAIEARLWQKLAINAGINPFTVILGCRNGELIGQPYFEDRLQPLTQEVQAVALASGIALTDTDLPARIREVARATAGNRSSMLQDILAGRRTEIDMINGFVVATGRRLGVATPVNEELVAAVKTREAVAD